MKRCKIRDVVFGINTGSENSRNWYIADNEIVGINQTWYPRPKEYMSPGHTGVNLYGQGHVVCHNHITRFSDSLAIYNFGAPVADVEKHCVAIDFYNNDLSWAQDDTMEADYGCHNVRVYRNRCYNAHTALSTQPLYGGPVYLIRNEAYSITSLTFKLNNYPAGIEAYNNTVCCARQGFRPPAIWQNGHFRNNLFVGGERLRDGVWQPLAVQHDGLQRLPPQRCRTVSSSGPTQPATSVATIPSRNSTGPLAWSDTGSRWTTISFSGPCPRGSLKPTCLRTTTCASSQRRNAWTRESPCRKSLIASRARPPTSAATSLARPHRITARDPDARRRKAQHGRALA